MVHPRITGLDGSQNETKNSIMNSTHQALAAREQMLAIVSHDIKNPLSVIQLEAQMLIKMASYQSENAFAEEVRNQANRILKTTERLKGLIVDLLEKSKSNDGLSCLNKSLCNVSKIFTDVLESNEPLILEKKISTTTSFAKDLRMTLDNNKMFQVLANLVGNAIKFTPIGGVIHLAIEEKEAEYLFSISDNGPGLKPSDLNSVFEKYWTAGVKGCSGTGLGLFICKTIVDAHGGHIFAENLPESGSRFWFTLPKECQEMAVNYLAKDNKRKILVIDDDNDLREVISWALGKEGFAIHSYADPKEALKNLKKGKHVPSLMVVDFQMEGMMGSEFIMQKMQIELPEVRECPVFLISASSEEAQEKISSDYYVEMIGKPLDLESLVQKIKLYVH